MLPLPTLSKGSGDAVDTQHAALLCLADGLLSIHTLPRLQHITTLPNTKGCSMYAVADCVTMDSQARLGHATTTWRTEGLQPSGPTSYVAAVVKRRLLLYKLVPGSPELLLEVKDFALPDVPRSVSWVSAWHHTSSSSPSISSQSAVAGAGRGGGPAAQYGVVSDLVDSSLPVGLALGFKKEYCFLHVDSGVFEDAWLPASGLPSLASTTTAPSDADHRDEFSTSSGPASSSSSVMRLVGTPLKSSATSVTCVVESAYLAATRDKACYVALPQPRGGGFPAVRRPHRVGLSG